MDLTYEGEIAPAEDPEVKWDSVIDKVIPATIKVSEGGATLDMPSIINLQESGLRRSPRIALRTAT